MRVGFIGLGNLGARLAGALLDGGFELTVHDRAPTAGDALVARGARTAESPAEAAAGADAVITCLPSPAVSTAVVAGDDGVLDGLRPGGTWIEMSTTDKRELLRVAALATDRGVATLEAPVTGGVHLAATGDITMLVGGRRRRGRDVTCPLFAVDGRRRLPHRAARPRDPTSR